MTWSYPRTSCWARTQSYSPRQTPKRRKPVSISSRPSITGHNGLLALSESAWWWTGIIPTAIPMLQGHTRRMDFRTLMVGAVELGTVRSPQF